MCELLLISGTLTGIVGFCRLINVNQIKMSLPLLIALMVVTLIFILIHCCHHFGLYFGVVI